MPKPSSSARLQRQARDGETCNDAARRIALGQLREDWGETGIPLSFPEGLPNMAPLESVRITDPTVVLRAPAEGGAGRS